MQTIAPRTHFACRYCHACGYCLRERLVCATTDVHPGAGAARRHDLAPAAVRARTHALHVLTIACKLNPRAWSLRAAGLALDQPFWLDMW